MTPRSTPSLYSLPGLSATVLPILASPRDSWMWPCRLSIGWYAAIASRTAELRWAADYAERLRHLMAADAVVALPGGIGTLSEAAMVWAAAQTEPDAAQLVLVGDDWRRVRDAVGAGLVVDDADLGLARCVPTVDDVVAAIREALAGPRDNRGPRG